MQTETETNTLNETSIIDDLHNGEIYLIKNKINGKCYVGQALCYTGSNNSKWGTKGRWKSHIREALNSTGDHCIALNNAIRKYGHDNFEVTTLVKCHKDEMDEHEIIYIAEYDSIQPNGYNIKSGGYSSKNNESTIQKMKIAHLGTRKDKKIRKHDEDNDLPKYIKAYRQNGNIKSYVITKFPIGIESSEYIKDTYFTISKYASKEDAYQNAINYLNELKQKYNYINEEVFKEKSVIVPPKKFIEKKEDKLKEKLPEYIYPIIEDKKLAGYFVDEIIDVQKNKPFPKRVFNEKTNRWNLDSAKKYIAILKYINEHKVDMSNFYIDEIDINDVSESFYEKYYLPKYFNIFRSKGVIVGFCINGFPSDKYKSGKYEKQFRLKTMKGIRTMDEAYEAGIEELNDLKKGYITI